MIHMVNFIIIIFIVVIFNFWISGRPAGPNSLKNSEMKKEDSSAAHVSPIYTWEGGWPNRHFTFFLP